MSYLGTLLDLPDGSRLTGIALQPLATETTIQTGTAYFHVVDLPDGQDPASTGGAVARFLPEALAVILGNEPEGGTWFATFQLAADDRDTVWVQGAADAAILRALNLTGLGDGYVWGQALSAGDLRAAYGGVTDVGEWSLPDLLNGLLLELGGTELADVVAFDRSMDSDPAHTAEHRRAHLDSLFHAWAATYEGPA